MTRAAPNQPPRRDTAQQRAIREAVELAGRPLSVQEIHDAAIQASPTLSLGTVYRVLKRLRADNVIVPVTIPGQPDRYEAAEAAGTHHHHFRCESCDRVFDVQGCPGGISNMLPAGFTLTGHELTLWGTCDQCE